MKVRYIGEEYRASLKKDMIYEVISVEKGWYRVIDEDGADKNEELPGYLYPHNIFEIVES